MIRLNSQPPLTFLSKPSNPAPRMAFAQTEDRFFSSLRFGQNMTPTIHPLTESDFPFSEDPDSSANILLFLSMLEGDDFTNFLLGHTFDIPKEELKGQTRSLIDIYVSPEQVLQQIDPAKTVAVTLKSAFGNGSQVKGAYLPPVGNQPVVIFSPGAQRLLEKYRGFFKRLNALGYGIFAYQYAFYDGDRNFISQRSVPFQDIWDNLTKDLNNISRYLQRGSDAKNISGVPFNKQVIAGHSTGGAISARVISENPRRNYPALALFAVPASFLEAAKRSAQGLLTESDYQQLNNDDALRTKLERAFGDSFNANRPIENILKRNTTPILYIQGEADALVRDNMYDLHDSIAYYCLPKVDHPWVMTNQQRSRAGIRSAHILDTFLRSQERFQDWFATA